MAKKEKVIAEVVNHPDLKRDLESSAIVNHDLDGFRAARRRKQAALNQIEKSKSLEKQVDTLTQQYNELKQLVETLLTKK